MTEYVLAVDGGGTKTEVVCASTDGVVIGQAVVGPTNLTSTSVGAASFNLREGIRQVTQQLLAQPQQNVVAERGPQLPVFEEPQLQDAQSPVEFAAVVIGLAGVDSVAEAERAKQVFRAALPYYSFRQFELVNDSVIALENGTDSPNAFVLIAGTGSVCFGRNEVGATARSSGMDFLLADQGSGYAIGRRVLQEAVKSFDGRRQHNVFEDLVRQHFEVESIAHLKDKVYSPLLSKLEVAQVAKLCSVALEQGEPLAQQIFEEAVLELVVMARAVIQRLSLTDQSVEAVFSGAILKVPLVREGVGQRLLEVFPHLLVKSPELNPVHGALKMAQKLAAAAR